MYSSLDGSVMFICTQVAEICSPASSAMGSRFYTEPQTSFHHCYLALLGKVGMPKASCSNTLRELENLGFYSPKRWEEFT